MPPLPPILSIDTLKVARQKFLFNSNRLDYLGQYFGVGKKLDNPSDLWLKVLNGDRKAITQMVAYNKEDVLLLERVFLKLKPFIPNYINRQLFGLDQDGSEIRCPDCGSTHNQAGPNHIGTTRAYKRYHCMKCLRWYRVNKALPAPRVTTRSL
jgi:DNA-directed RNA polymerase subunit RPC12/RpoP